MAEKLLKKPKQLSVSSFFALRRFIVDEIINYNNAYPYILGLLLRSTKRIGNVTVVHRSRKIGRSGYTFRKLVSLWLNGFTAFSVVPLRIASFCGFLFSFIGFFCMCYCILNKLLHPQVPIGYSSIMTAIIFIGGVLMLILGMTGEYIGRIYICLNKSPQYVIRAYAGETKPDFSERKIGS